jgi:DNA-binding winged helix-turn-helix (wHTH) protein
MTFVLGNCEIHCDRRELHRSGTVVHVEPQVFDVLVHLVRHRDRVVSKEELIRTVWEGRFVSDDTLTSRVNAARGRSVTPAQSSNSYARSRGVDFASSVKSAKN